MTILKQYSSEYIFEKILTTARKGPGYFRCEILEHTTQTYYVLVAEDKDGFKHADTLKKQYESLATGRILHNYYSESYTVCIAMINNYCDKTYPY
ncbi:TPA: hypothetical protein ACGOYD_002226 [Streptococcus suis]